MTNLKRSNRTGKLICGCGRGYASEVDHTCRRCRGMTLWEAHCKAVDKWAKEQKLELAMKGFIQ